MSPLPAKQQKKSKQNKTHSYFLLRCQDTSKQTHSQYCALNTPTRSTGSIPSHDCFTIEGGAFPFILHHESFKSQRWSENCNMIWFDLAIAYKMKPEMIKARIVSCLWTCRAVLLFNKAPFVRTVHVCDELDVSRVEAGGWRSGRDQETRRMNWPGEATTQITRKTTLDIRTIVKLSGPRSDHSFPNNQFAHFNAFQHLWMRFRLVYFPLQ